MRGRLPLYAGTLLVLLLVVAVIAAVSTVTPKRTPYSPPSSGVGSARVSLSLDAARDPQGENVRSLLQRHYDAINRRDYAAWRDTVADTRSERLDEATWRKAYATTLDGSVRVQRIDAGPVDGDGRTTLRVLLRFVSVQDPASAPPSAQAPRLCWRNSLPLAGAPWRIGVTAEGDSTPEPC